MPDVDDLALARWEVATLTGRLRCAEDERDAAVRDRDRSRDLVAALHASRPYRIGRVLIDLARDPVRTGPRLARRIRRRPARTPRRPPAAEIPGTVYVAIGLDRDDARDLVRVLRQRIVVDPDHVPVVVTDQVALHGLRVPGVILEYLPDRHTWERHRPSDGWETLLAGRVAQLCRDHRATRAVVVDPRDPPTLARLLDRH